MLSTALTVHLFPLHHHHNRSRRYRRPHEKPLRIINVASSSSSLQEVKKQPPPPSSDERKEVFTSWESIGLPPVTAAKRVVLVRHGQSTWNAEGRIQGSSDFSVLTQKGESQAETSRQMLLDDSFDVCFSRFFASLIFFFFFNSVNCWSKFAVFVDFRGSVNQLFLFYHKCCSPLVRSKRTAEIIWGTRREEILTDSNLREIDLYSFQVSVAYLIFAGLCY